MAEPFKLFVLHRLPDRAAPEDGTTEEHWEMISWPVESLQDITSLRTMCGGRQVGSYRELPTLTIEDQVFKALLRSL